ncbi:MAG: radical SAM protein [Chitinivibrionales bacterium]|nr:radical SAM protein [Chitinivibrionales bacterium]
MLTVCEIFRSIQGESSWSGKICSFVRFSGCNLRCSYCDTAYAWEGGTPMAIEEVLSELKTHKTVRVEITGGEPLIQPEAPGLCRMLLDTGYCVLVETNGSQDISRLPEGCIRIMDIKCPSSKMAGSFLASNIGNLRAADECKFIVTDRRDFEWACDFVKRHGLLSRCTTCFSPNSALLNPGVLAGWVLAENIDVRVGIQLHKVLWGAAGDPKMVHE